MAWPLEPPKVSLGLCLGCIGSGFRARVSFTGIRG